MKIRVHNFTDEEFGVTVRVEYVVKLALSGHVELSGEDVRLVDVQIFSKKE